MTNILIKGEKKVEMDIDTERSPYEKDNRDQSDMSTIQEMPGIVGYN